MKIVAGMFFFFLMYSFSYGQAEVLNQVDSAGKKHGKWILYLDEGGDKLTDSVGAVCFRYTYYDHGVHIYPMGGFIGKREKIEPALSSGNRKIEALDGEYKCFDKNGTIRFIHVFDKGKYISYKEFFASGELHEYFDYTKHCNEQMLSWYMYMYDKKGNTTYEECIKKNENGEWPKMRG